MSTNTITKKKKTLSDATRGMRFMQRRIAETSSATTSLSTNSSANGGSKTIKQLYENDNGGNGYTSPSTVVKKRDENEWEMDTAGNNDEKQRKQQQQAGGPTPMDIDSNPLLDQSSTSKNNAGYASAGGEQIPLFEIASKEDMYGISSEIIGRRSFNNFNKAVQETYQAAIHARRRDKIDKKVEREHISDEELLKRYEQYVKGRGDMSSSSPTNRLVNYDVGNLKEKVAKKRKR